MLRIRPYRSADEAELLRVLDVDRIPGQPEVTRQMLANALQGHASIDAGHWSELSELRTMVAVSAEGAVAGALSSGYRERDDSGVVLWLHGCEDADVLAGLLRDTLDAYGGCDRVVAFDFATPLTAGLEALPIRHRPVTRSQLERFGFVEMNLWRYMVIDPCGIRCPDQLGARYEWAVSGSAGQDTKLVLLRDGTSVVETEIGIVADGIGAIWWIETAERHRRAGLGRYALMFAVSELARRGADVVILYVDDDEPDPSAERSRRAANHLYDSTGFVEVDRLCSYRRERCRPSRRVQGDPSRAALRVP